MLGGLNEALKYIEEHLDAKIDLKEVAKRAYSSEYHFKRMFSLMSGITISEYIRRRRLTLAALELKDSDIKVIDLAVKYDYKSPDAFSRAFQNFHGVTPSAARRTDHNLKAYPKMSFQLTIKGGVEMNYRIIKKEPFRIIGVKYDVEMANEILSPTYESMIENISDSQFEELATLSTGTPSGIVHASTNYKEEEDGAAKFNQYIGAVSDEKADEYSTLEVASYQWAIFEVAGDWKHVEKVWERIYTEWLPSSTYELDVGPEILASNNEKSEIWISIKNKE